MKSKDREGDAARRNVRMWGVFGEDGEPWNAYRDKDLADNMAIPNDIVRPVTVSWEEKKELK